MKKRLLKFELTEIFVEIKRVVDIYLTNITNLLSMKRLSSDMTLGSLTRREFLRRTGQVAAGGALAYAGAGLIAPRNAQAATKAEAGTLDDILDKKLEELYDQMLQWWKECNDLFHTQFKMYRHSLDPLIVASMMYGPAMGISPRDTFKVVIQAYEYLKATEYPYSGKPHHFIAPEFYKACLLDKGNVERFGKVYVQQLEPFVRGEIESVRGQYTTSRRDAHALSRILVPTVLSGYDVKLVAEQWKRYKDHFMKYDPRDEYNAFINNCSEVLLLKPYNQSYIQASVNNGMKEIKSYLRLGSSPANLNVVSSMLWMTGEKLPNSAYGIPLRTKNLLKMFAGIYKHVLSNTSVNGNDLSLELSAKLSDTLTEKLRM